MGGGGGGGRKRGVLRPHIFYYLFSIFDKVFKGLLCAPDFCGLFLSVKENLNYIYIFYFCKRDISSRIVFYLIEGVDIFF